MEQTSWEKAVAFHGHRCPGLAIGVRAALVLQQLWQIRRAEDEDLVCITENDACGVDGIQALLGCTMGKGNLLYHGTGKMAFSFYDRKNGRSCRLYLKAQRGSRSREEYQEYLLHGPQEEIFSIGEVRTALPERARLFASRVCEVCGDAAPEHKMRLQEGKVVCLDCFSAYDRGW